MKEATGETNMTIITIVLIAAVLVVARPLLTSITESIGTKWNEETSGDGYEDQNYANNG